QVPQPAEALAQPQGAALQVRGVGLVGEDEVLELFDLFVEGLQSVEVPVDEQVEQAVQQEAGAALGQFGGAVPALGEGVDVGGVVAVQGDQHAVGDERVELRRLEHA